MSSKRENFYRRDPGLALAGMAGLKPEERGIYNTILDLLYLTWRPLEDDRGYIAAHCNCAVQKLNPILAKLVAIEKLLFFTEGGRVYISNKAFEEERTEIKGSTKTRSGRGEVGEKSAGVGENPPTCGENVEEKPTVIFTEKRREEKNSDPNGSGGTAPTEPVVESRKPLPDWIDQNQEAWARAVRLLVQRGGMREASARAFFGKLISASKLEASYLLAAIVSAETKGTADPQAYLTRAVANIAERVGKTLPTSVDPSGWTDSTWAVAYRLWTEKGRWDETMGPEPGRPGCKVPSHVMIKPTEGAAA